MGNYIKLFEKYVNDGEMMETIKEILYPFEDDGIPTSIYERDNYIIIEIGQRYSKTLTFGKNYINEFKSLFKYFEQFNLDYFMPESFYICKNDEYSVIENNDLFNLNEFFETLERGEDFLFIHLTFF